MGIGFGKDSQLPPHGGEAELDGCQASPDLARVLA
jgi:hypothetical protein